MVAPDRSSESEVDLYAAERRRTEALLAETAARTADSGAADVRRLTAKRARIKRSSSREADWLSLVRAIKGASMGGARRISMTVWEHKVASGCQCPLTFELWARRAPELIARDKHLAAVARWSAAEAAKLLVGDDTWSPRPTMPARQSSYLVDGKLSMPVRLIREIPCRECEHCLKLRRRRWYVRALRETEQSQRTWFGTLTLSPEQHSLMAMKARKRCRDRSLNWDELSGDEQFRVLDGVIAADLWRRFMKRVRKQTGASLRTLLVTEVHKSGLPHYHCLVHEQEQSAKVAKSTLEAQWRVHGFTSWRLVKDQKQAGYVVKYLGKELRARVRASQRYGETLCSDSETCIGADTAPTHKDGGGGNGGRSAPQANEVSASPPSTIVDLGPRCSCKDCTMRAAESAARSEAGFQSEMISDEHAADD